MEQKPSVRAESRGTRHRRYLLARIALLALLCMLAYFGYALFGCSYLCFQGNQKDNHHFGGSNSLKTTHPLDVLAVECAVNWPGFLTLVGCGGERCSFTEGFRKSRKQ